MLAELLEISLYHFNDMIPGSHSQGMPVKGPVTPQVFDHRFCQGNHAVPAALAAAHPEFALVPLYVMDR